MERGRDRQYRCCLGSYDIPELLHSSRIPSIARFVFQESMRPFPLQSFLFLIQRSRHCLTCCNQCHIRNPYRCTRMAQHESQSHALLHCSTSFLAYVLRKSFAYQGSMSCCRNGRRVGSKARNLSFQFLQHRLPCTKAHEAERSQGI